MKTNPQYLRRGFTMIELLVVIIVIGILAAILLPALSGAVRKARIAAVAMEIGQLDTAVETYKTQNGDYPPDCTNILAIQTHIRRAFARSVISINGTSWGTAPATGVIVCYSPNTVTTRPNYPNCYPGNLNPSEALYFWLAMIVNNAADPLDSSAMTTFKTPLYSFDQSRLRDVDNDGFFEYYPKFGETAPYVYFNSATYGSASGPLAAMPPVPAVPSFVGTSVGAMGVARPYLAADGTAAANGTMPPASWMNQTKFQIISAGLDGDYGYDIPSGTTIPIKVFPSALFPTGKSVMVDSAGNASGDRDNIANFSEGKTLEDNRK